MRPPASLVAIQSLMKALGERCKTAVDIYFTGGATAVLHGWRESTIDVDLKPEPDSDELLRVMATLKDELHINLELACPSDFIPELPNWRDRCIFIERNGKVGFYHYDPYAQTLAKIERGHAQDIEDVQHFFESGLVGGGRLRQFMQAILPSLYKYPAIHPPTFQSAVEEAISAHQPK